MFEKTHSLLLGQGGAGKLALVAVGKWAEAASGRCLVVLATDRLEYEYVHPSQVESPAAFVAARLPEYSWSAPPEGSATLNLKAQLLGVESRLSKRTLNLGKRQIWRCM